MIFLTIFILLKLFTVNNVSWWWIILFMAIDSLRFFIKRYADYYD
jgi:hypothetical protein